MRLEKGMGIRLARRGLFKEKGHTIELMDHLVGGGGGKEARSKKNISHHWLFFLPFPFLHPSHNSRMVYRIIKIWWKKGGRETTRLPF